MTSPVHRGAADSDRSRDECTLYRTSTPTTTIGVTAVIAHYRAADMTANLVKQLQAQQTSRPLQIVVSDDASPLPYPPGMGYEVVRSEQNGGFGAAVNRGAARACEPVLLILNSDLSVSPRFVDELMAAAARWLPNSLCGPRIYEPNGRESEPRQFPRHRFYVVEWLGFLARWRDTPRWRVLRGAFPLRTSITETLVDWVVGAAMLVSTERFHSVGGMDEQFHMYMEEVDLQRRLRTAGGPSVYLGSVEVEHQHGGSSPEGGRLSAILNARLLYELKWSGWTAVRRLQMMLTVATLVDLASDIVRRLNRRNVKPFGKAWSRLQMIWDGPTPFRRYLE